MDTTRRLVRQIGIDTQYVLLGFPIGLVSLTVLLTFFGIGVGTSLFWGGLFVVIGVLWGARGLATVERARLGPVLHKKLPHPRYKKRLWWTPLTDGQSWLDFVHGVFRFIPETVAFSFVIVWWSCTLFGLTYWAWGWVVPQSPDSMELPELLGLGESFGVRAIFYAAVGVFFGGTLIPVLRCAALLPALFAQAMLSGVDQLREQVAEAEAQRDTARAQRAAAVSAEAIALRKLERDIHDGPQQRLVRLAMDLGRAEHQFETDPQAARATVAEAITQTRETLDELRSLSRGIAPPILVDRGLKAALAALAGRCTIPVDLDVAEVGRLDPALESTAYFVVAEALTNAAKHSRASEVLVRLRRTETGLAVTVADDGAGGASLAKGHGLAGLNDRVEAAGGLLDLVSPVGAGTTLTVALPL
jgi:signal transduction histidine kinase